MIYEFRDLETGEITPEIVSGTVSIGHRMSFPDGSVKERVISGFRYGWAKGQNPSRDDDRRLENKMFNERQHPDLPSDAELVQSGVAKTQDMSRWI